MIVVSDHDKGSVLSLITLPRGTFYKRDFYEIGSYRILEGLQIDWKTYRFMSNRAFIKSKNNRKKCVYPYLLISKYNSYLHIAESKAMLSTAQDVWRLLEGSDTYAVKLDEEENDWWIL